MDHKNDAQAPDEQAADGQASDEQASEAARADSSATQMNQTLFRTTMTLVLVYLAAYLLIVAKSLLIPLVLATFIWFLITSLRQALEKLRYKQFRLSRTAAFSIALGLIALAALGFANLVGDNVAQVMKEAPSYQQNLERRFADLTDDVGIDVLEELNPFVESLKLSELIGRSATTLTSILGDAGLIAVYLLFLFVEERAFDRKLEALLTEPERREEIRSLLVKISDDTRAYVGLKTLVSLMTALPSYAIMSWVGLDFAAFWAILIFIFNFVPNIGSLIATLLPSLLALLQFQGWKPFFIIVVGVVATQLLVANLIEPRIMARSLNLSPLVIILSLVVWGTIWGIAGMFLCVPLMVIVMIVLAHFPATRPIAILLSEDGRVRGIDP